MMAEAEVVCSMYCTTVCPKVTESANTQGWAYSKARLSPHQQAIAHVRIWGVTLCGFEQQPTFGTEGGDAYH